VRRVLERAFAASCERFETRLVHYSIQSNHVHMIVESDGRQALSRAMQGFAIRVAKALNKLWDRTGKVFADRYHDRILRTPREVRNALVYVLKNHAKHGIAIAGLDPFASGRSLDGWEDVPLPRARADMRNRGRTEHACPAARAKTWLLGTGWKLLGLLQLAEMPRGAR
jgi:REP element-mobilizing transposase RayT